MIRSHCGLHSKSLGFTDLGNAKYGNDNGLDFVGTRTNDQGVEELWVLEVKPFKDGGTGLNPTTNSGVQLSDRWLRNAIDRMDVSTPEQQTLQDQLRQQLNLGTIKTGVLGYDPVRETMSFVPVKMP